MNALELRSAHDALEQELNTIIQDQGNHTELSYLLKWLSQEKVRTLLNHIRELRSMRQPVTYELLASFIGEEEPLL